MRTHQSLPRLESQAVYNLPDSIAARIGRDDCSLWCEFVQLSEDFLLQRQVFRHTLGELAMSTARSSCKTYLDHQPRVL
jgi:hypothetical protein